MKFNYSNDRPVPSPEYDQPYGTTLPPLQAKGTMSYLDFIDVVNYLWSKGHPEIFFGPFGSQTIFDPELGYMIYNLEDKKPKTNHPKPKLYETRNHPTDTTKKIAIFIENFDLIVKFTAVHKAPRVAEEMIEEFENFMITITPVLRMNGLENILYIRRMPDSHETRFGDDVSSRAIAYMIGVQKILIEEMDKLEEIHLQVQAVINGDATPSYTSATPSYIIRGSLLDNNMSL